MAKQSMVSKANQPHEMHLPCATSQVQFMELTRANVQLMLPLTLSFSHVEVDLSHLDKKIEATQLESSPFQPLILKIQVVPW